MQFLHYGHDRGYLYGTPWKSGSDYKAKLIPTINFIGKTFSK